MHMYKKVFTNLLFVWRKEMRAVEALEAPCENVVQKPKKEKRQKRIGFGEGALATRWNKKEGERFCSKDEQSVRAHRIARKRPAVFVILAQSPNEFYVLIVNFIFPSSFRHECMKL